MKLRFLSLPFALALIVTLSTTTALAQEERQTGPEYFGSEITNEFLPFSSVALKVLEGEELDPESGETVETRVEERLQSETRTIAGVEVLVIEAKDIEDGDLVELTLDYYAQHEDGTVYYFGEDVDDYEDGEVVGHDGTWIAGEDGAEAGVFMPAEPTLLANFAQEQAPGQAEDMTTVIELDVDVLTPAGDFSGCIKTLDFDPIGGASEFKFYCPGVGLVREEFPGGFVELIEYELVDGE